VGTGLGSCVGFGVGTSVGFGVGNGLGSFVGFGDGTSVGFGVGFGTGCAEGFGDGTSVGFGVVGIGVGFGYGTGVGLVGAFEYVGEGVVVLLTPFAISLFVFDASIAFSAFSFTVSTTESTALSSTRFAQDATFAPCGAAKQIDDRQYASSCT